MPKYAILLHPGHNRVYYAASKTLSVAEFEIVTDALPVCPATVKGEEFGGLYYLVFEAEQTLGEEALACVARLSFALALYQLEGAGAAITLKPVRLPRKDYIAPDIGGMLKYSGKTNELFTHMMINVAQYSSAFGEQERLRLLDPVAGKGTTLLEGLVCGMDVCGIEIVDRTAQEAYQFLKKYLELGKYKHSTAVQRQSGENKAFTCVRRQIVFANSKQAQKSGDTRSFEMISGNAAVANQLYKRNNFHLIVGDLPYGVQHGSKTASTREGLTRNPKELLAACLPAWHKVLMPGGALALAWNEFTLTWEAVAALLTTHGFAVCDKPVYRQFQHRVDQAISRNLIVAVKERV